jgi:hypothetical protein
MTAMQQGARSLPPAGLEQSLRRYLTLAQTCHELFAVAFREDQPPEHAAMDELLRALREQETQGPPAPQRLHS